MLKCCGGYSLNSLHCYCLCLLSLPAPLPPMKQYSHHHHWLMCSAAIRATVGLFKTMAPRELAACYRRQQSIEKCSTSMYPKTNKHCHNVPLPVNVFSYPAPNSVARCLSTACVPPPLSPSYGWINVKQHFNNISHIQFNISSRYLGAVRFFLIQLNSWFLVRAWHFLLKDFFHCNIRSHH